MQSVVSFLHDCHLGKKQVHRNLTVFPVLFPDVLDPYYLTLEEAIDTGALVWSRRWMRRAVAAGCG